MINKLDSIERIAGVDTVEAEVSPEESIKVLKEAVQIYYDFLTGRTNICDIDFFKKAPVINDRGTEWFGTKRLKAPEDYQRYCKNQFSPCSLSNWQLSEESYRVASKAVSLNKSERYLTFADFFGEWKRCYDIWKEN